MGTGTPAEPSYAGDAATGERTTVVVLGVDLSSQPRGTAGCLTEWTGSAGRVVALVDGLDDAGLATLAEGAEIVAIDAPFGWPSTFVAAVSGHAVGEPWPGSDLRDLRFRATDHHVRDEVGWWPLSVSSDLIGVVAFRAARILSRLRPDDPSRDGSNGLVEVYPAAALARWGLPRRGYKRPEHRDQRLAIVAGLRCLFDLDLGPDEARLVTSADALDALVASIMGWCFASGRASPIPEQHRQTARIEGWIHLPPARSPARGSSRLRGFHSD